MKGAHGVNFGALYRPLSDYIGYLHPLQRGCREYTGFTGLF